MRRCPRARKGYSLSVSRRRFYLIVLIVFVPVSYLALTMLPIGPRTATYLAADGAPEPPIGSLSRHIMIVDVPRFSTPPLFRLENGRLFLLIQDHRHALVLTTMSGSEPRWTSETLKVFRAEHPGLEIHWPKPEQADAGVVWLGRKF